MRILLVIEAAGGGSGRHVIDLARELARQGHHVAVIYSPTRTEPRFEAEIAALPIVLARLPMRRAVGPWDIPTARAMKRLVAQLGPFDIVHAHSSKAGALLRAVAPKGAARVYTPHAFRTMDPGLGGAARVAYGVVEALLARFCTDALIAVAPEEAAHARNLGIPARKIHTIVNGVSPAPPVNRVEARAELGLAPDDIAVGFVGRLCEQKDPERFARAIRIARAADPRIRGVVLGDGELAEGVRRAGGDGVALFKGRDARLFLPAFDLFAMTSRYEGMPYVLLEALQAGLPIVSTEVGGTSVAVDGRNGLLAPVDVTAEGFAALLLKMTDPVTRAAMASASAKLGETVTVETMVAATKAIYAMARLGAHSRTPRELASASANAPAS